MKMTKLLSALLVITLTLCAVVIPVGATEGEEPAHNHEHIDVIIVDEVDAETEARIVAYFTEGAEDDEAAAYGLTCTLFGHKYDSQTVKTVTHKARTTAPRCLQKVYDYQLCSRCGDETSTLISSSYIYCCS